MKTKLLLVLVFLAQLCYAQIEGTWYGEVDLQIKKLPVILKIKKTADGYTSLLNSPQQSKDDINVDRTSFINNELNFEIKKINATYKGTFQNDLFEGIFIQNGKTIPLHFSRDPNSSKGKNISYLKGKAINAEKLNKFLDYIAQKNQGIGSVSIFRNGIQEYHKDFGQQQVKNITYDKNTQYHIGSISKLFTSVLLMQLVEKGRLDLNEKLSKFYPEIANSKNITIRQMLNHTSGLGNYISAGAEGWLIGKAVGDKAIITAIKDQGLHFQPGKGIKYSNSAYFLLSRILEKLYNGKPYHEILKQNIIEKADMKYTFSVMDNPQNIFKPYKFTNDNWEEIPDFDFRNCIGVGDIVSTTEDMNTFIDALFNGKFIKKETLDMMTSNKKELMFGTGIMKPPFYNIISYGHGGDTYGSHSMLSYEPTDKLAFAITINGERFVHNNLYIGILNILYGQDYQFPQFEEDKKTSETDLYSGSYTSKEAPLDLKVFTKDGTLYAQGSGQPEFPLTYTEKNKYKFDEAGITIVFIPENSQLKLMQGKNTYLFNKK
ncbi:serine hydrolase domain-containing protein [Chryseobacterium vaccae]|uniref:serine hydrolase domain-containing protein n=1 Tax=Chryseobacterium vaccae TaxID=2604424 RepID=UPI0012965FA3|nr:serine hydrolase domain-containing protein [Chryseobacterium vaccae]